jgi:hemolysin III
MSGLVRPRIGMQNIPEETANQLTHGLGLVLSMAGAAVLVSSAKQHSDRLQFVGCCIYSASLVALYAASTLSHSFQAPRARYFFRMLDQVCIFLLITGTFTPFAFSYFVQGWLWGLTLTMWALTCVGIFFKLCFRRMSNVATGAYVLLAWIPVIAVHEIVRVMPFGGLALIVAGGALYMAGVYFLTHDEKVPYYHAVWHVLVVSASICHYCAVMFYVIPPR